MPNKLRKWRLHWVSGAVEEIEGETLAQAYANAGHDKKLEKWLRWSEELMDEIRLEEVKEKINA